MSVTASSLLGLVPSVICKKEVDLKAVIDLYSRDIPLPVVIEQELKQWKLRWERKMLKTKTKLLKK